jgi:hypothetical protein
LQHPVDKRPKVHLDGVEFTLKYRDGVWKVVAKLGTGLVNRNHCKMALLGRVRGAMGNLRDIGDTWPGDPASGLTEIAAAPGGLRDAPIS